MPSGTAEVIRLTDDRITAPLVITPFFRAYADPEGSMTGSEAYLQGNRFVPFSDFNLKKPDQPFWLRLSLETAGNLRRNHLSIHFASLTYVDLYIFRQGKQILHRQAGAFREKRLIDQQDERFNFHVSLLPGHTYTLLIRVHHSNQYQPNTMFAVQDQFVYQENRRITASIHYLLLGAISILSCYCLLAYVFIRYKPFLWTFFFLAGVAAFSYALDPDFIDFFFPNRPKTGWLLPPPFLHLGVIGFYLMVLHLLRLKKAPRRFSNAGQLLILLLILFDLFGLLNKVIGSNYYQTTRYHLLFVFVHLAYLSWVAPRLWKKLDAAQRYWGYAIVIFAATTVFIVAVAALLKEDGYPLLSMGSKISALIMGILFLMGINRQQKQYEEEKFMALRRLNELQQRHTELVEKKVTERTKQLAHINERLKRQRALLLEKNQHIETLMDELNHRVKNNLQMLYSLNTLQLPKVKDREGKRILDDTRARVKSMMLVNEYLSGSGTSKAVSAAAFMEDIIRQVRQIYDRDNRVSVAGDVQQHVHFDNRTALPFGLIITELLTNVYKHAFPTELSRQPLVNLSLAEGQGTIVLSFEDNGIGTDAPVQSKDSMGMLLIHGLARQLKGSVKLRREQGYHYQITFVNPNYADSHY